MRERSVGTHDGTFHADEITAVALLLFFGCIDRDKIVRTRDPEKLQECEYVCDVGGVYDPKRKRFDHHQTEYQGTLSSAGMVWLYLKNEGLASDELYAYFQRMLVQSVDAQDQGFAPKESWLCTFSSVIANFVPAHYDAPKDVVNAAFFEALDFVFGHLKRLCARFDYIQSCRAKVKEAMAPGKKYLLFEEPMPWMDAFFAEGGESHPARYVIMPTQGRWKLKCIPPTLDLPMKMRKPLPEAWAGLSNEALARATGIPGAIFCHKGRFISIWATKEDALKAAEEL